MKSSLRLSGLKSMKHPTLNAGQPQLSIDLDLSDGVYLWDRITDRLVLDLWNQFSSLPLGYDSYGDVSPVLPKISFGGCGGKDRDEVTALLLGCRDLYPDYHVYYCNTGSLAVEAAIRAAIEIAGTGRDSQVVSIIGSYHGSYGYSAALLSDEDPGYARVRNTPTTKLRVRFHQDEPDFLVSLEHYLVTRPVAAVIVEPIQCSSGDIVIPPTLLTGIRQVCTDTGTPLIFDEIQTGFGATSTFWYYQQLTNCVPDIVVFGKRAQVSGFMSQAAFNPALLAQTWQGELYDFIRCRHVLTEYERQNILANVSKQGAKIEALLAAKGLSVRRTGLLIAIDFFTRTERDYWCDRMWGEGVLVNPTGERCVRLRPPLNIDDETIDDLQQKVQRATNQLVYEGYVP